MLQLISNSFAMYENLTAWGVPRREECDTTTFANLVNKNRPSRKKNYISLKNFGKFINRIDIVRKLNVCKGTDLPMHPKQNRPQLYTECLNSSSG